MSVCHRNMSSTWGYYPVTEEALAAEGRGGGETKSWRGFLSASLSNRNLSDRGALRTRAQKALRGSLCLTLSVLDNIQVLYKIEMWFTRLTRETRRVPLSCYGETAYPRAYLLGVKWSARKMADLSIKLATASYLMMIGLKNKRGTHDSPACHRSVSVFMILFFSWFVFPERLLKKRKEKKIFGSFLLKEHMCLQFSRAIIFWAVWFWYSGCHLHKIRIPGDDSSDAECAPREQAGMQKALCGRAATFCKTSSVIVLLRVASPMAGLLAWPLSNGAKPLISR